MPDVQSQDPGDGCWMHLCELCWWAGAQLRLPPDQSCWELIDSRVSSRILMLAHYFLLCTFFGENAFFFQLILL